MWHVRERSGFTIRHTVDQDSNELFISFETGNSSSVAQNMMQLSGDLNCHFKHSFSASTKLLTQSNNQGWGKPLEYPREGPFLNSSTPSVWSPFPGRLEAENFLLCIFKVTVGS